MEIEGLTDVPIPDFEKARWWYTKGRRVRSTSWTNVNEASSRSHWWVMDLVIFLDSLNGLIWFDNYVIFLALYI